MSRRKREEETSGSKNANGITSSSHEKAGTPVKPISNGNGVTSHEHPSTLIPDTQYEAVDGASEKPPRTPTSQSGSRKGKERATTSRRSNHSSNAPASSYTSWERTSSSAGYRASSPRDHRHASPDVDPGQIVRMALTLNESRRLGLAPGQLPAASSIVNRRAVSAGVSLSVPPLVDHQQPRHVSSTLPLPAGREMSRSPTASLTLPNGRDQSRAASSSRTASRVSSVLSPGDYEAQARYDISPATLMRADKARAYFELCHEHRRLLEFLPPLRPTDDLNPAHVLGRQYNPLQYIRNRRIRARGRQSLDGESDGWANVDRVDAWVTAVEMEANDAAFLEGDIALLPPFESAIKSRVPDGEGNTSETQRLQGRNDWRVDPADMLADAYWLERDSHKTLLEDRNWDKIFTKLSKPTPRRRSRAATRGTLDSSENKFLERYSDDTNQSNPPPHSEGSDDSDMDDGLLSRVPKRHEKPKKSRHRFLRRHRDMTDDEATGSETDDRSIIDRVEYLGSGPNPEVNLGPLEKHMNRMIQKEGRNNSVASETSLQPSSPENARGHRRRGGLSEEYNESEEQHQRSNARKSVDTMAARSQRSSVSTSTPGTPRISVDDYDRDDDQINGYAISPASNVHKKRAFPLGFIHKRGKSKKQNMIAENDFAIGGSGNLKSGAFDFRKSLDSPRSSGELTRTKSDTSLLDTADDRRRSAPDLAPDEEAETEEDPKALSSATTRFFKGGRIGEIVRHEASPKAEVIWKAEPPRKGSKTPSGNDLDSSPSKLFAPREHRRSRSTNDLTKADSKYHVPDLPSFKSSHVSGTDTPSDSDHIARQQEAVKGRKQSRKSRFDRLSPISTNGTPEISPNTSQTDLSRQQTMSSYRLDKPSWQPSRSSSTGIGAAGSRLNQVLSKSGGVGGRDLPMTSLAKVDAKQRSRSRHHREWNIAEDQDASAASAAKRRSDAPITAKDIAYVKSLLLSSGIKAYSIVTRANEPPNEPSDFLVKASKSSQVPLKRASRREEHVVAARLLSERSGKIVSNFEADAETFRSKTCAELLARIDDLRDQVGSHLTEEVRTCADDADAFIAKLTTTHTLAVKQVNDSVELMMRSRWRRLRWLRRAGFTMLEWVLVGIMWLIWLFVSFFKAIRVVIVGAIRGTRWMLWL